MNYPFIVLALWAAALWAIATRVIKNDIKEIKDDYSYFSRLHKERLDQINDRVWEIDKAIERQKLSIDQMHAEIMPDVNTAPDVKAKRRRAKKTKQEDTARIANLDDS